MDINYKPNSHKYKEGQAAAEEKKKVEKVITGTATTRKKSGFRKMFEGFKTSIWGDVLIPAFKKIVSESVDIALHGTVKRRDGSGLAERVSYRSYYDEPRTRSTATVSTRHGYSYDEIILESRGDAERVLSQMNDLIETYDMVSVADLYDLVGITGEYTDNKYGWTNIRNAEIVRVGNGYLIQMPKALPIK